jgi:hypothetical protein
MTRVSVSVSDDHMDRFGEVAEAARGAGLDIEHQLPVLGVLSGSIHPSRVKALEQVPGIQSVEEDHEYQLEPPESGIQSAAPAAPADSSKVWDEDSDIEASGGSRTVDWSARSEPEGGS